MWRDVGDDGTLTYTFIESIKASYPYYVVRNAWRLNVPRWNVDDGIQRRQNPRFVRVR